MLTTAAVLAATLLSPVAADVYMQSPRGANGRNCERNVNRNNANRLYDTQNNAKGGKVACTRWGAILARPCRLNLALLP